MDNVLYKRLIVITTVTTFYSILKLIIIHAEKTKEITNVKEVWMCDLNYHKIR